MGPTDRERDSEENDRRDVRTESDTSGRVRDGSSDRADDHFDDREHATQAFDADTEPVNKVAGFTTYADDKYGYAVAYPTKWSVEAAATSDPAFEAGAISAGAMVFVDEHQDDSLQAYVGAFLDELCADENVASLEVVDRRDVTIHDGHEGHIVECTYLGDTLDDRWRLKYLFVRVGETGYTVGVDWKEDEAVEAVARRILESFAIKEEN